MYDELVKRLRNCATEAAPCKTRDMTIVPFIAQKKLSQSQLLRKCWKLSKPHWIPVTELLPEKHELVLVRSKLVKMKKDFISNDGSWYITPGVTHWMPLPTPPKEET